MNATPLQTTTADFRTTRPLLSLWTACSLLDCGELEILKKVESGLLPFAWDIRRSKASRSCLRVLARSVSELQKSGKADASCELRQVIDSILPRFHQTIPSTEIARLLNCGGDHVANLIRDGLLGRFEVTKPPKQAPKITRQSFVQFLTERRI